MAGTGKSTISRTVAHDLHKRGQLGASFFFKRGERDRGTATRFFTTLAVQLAQRSFSIRRSVADVLSRRPDLPYKALSEQFSGLIANPLVQNSHDLPTAGDIILVIDALDKVENESDIQTVLTLFC